MNTAPPVPSATNTSPFKTPSLSASELVLSDDQERAAKRITNFILDPDQSNLILRGYAGTGKSTLMKYIFDSIPRINKLAKVVGNDDTERQLIVSASTNKAAGALRQQTNQWASTIHSVLGLALWRDPMTQKQRLMQTNKTNAIHDALIILDEAYMCDDDVLRLIRRFTHNCKILWVGDPAQLLPVGMSYAPLAIQEYPEVALEKIVRQAADNPIIKLATLCRHAVETNRFFKFKPDGHYVQHVSRQQFEMMMLDAFDEHNTTPGAVKTLSWTNKTAIAWNNHVKQKLKGTLEINVGDYVVCNSAIRNKQACLRTDQTVQITNKMPASSSEGVDGFVYTMDDLHQAFMPANSQDKTNLIKTLRKEGSPTALKRVNEILDTWVDLRDEYACTVNKSQGSTYGTAFIDLDDISKCRSANQLARLLYVATSRPKDKIVLTGDIQ